MPKKVFSSPLAGLLGYSLLSLLLIVGFHFIFPGQEAPLRIFSVPWRIVRGILAYIGLYPALALSALALPFASSYDERERYPRFSPRFFDRVSRPLLAAIAAAMIYGLLFFLALPLARRVETRYRQGGELFRMARERTGEFVEAEDWAQADQFLGICERIWPESPETASLRVSVAIGLEDYRPAAASPLPQADQIPLPGHEPLGPGEALVLAEQALREERYFDAHWLANLGMRLAKAGSVEAAEGARLAGYAWNAISSLEPNAQEQQVYGLYRQKRDGYEAMVAGDWVRAFYIFQDLLGKTPLDPDVRRFFAMCEQGVATVAFFSDEMRLALGDILTGVVLSLPGEGQPETQSHPS